MEWKIYDKNNNYKSSVHSIEYNGSWMGESYVSASIKSPTLIMFQYGDYLIYRGERYELNYIPTLIDSSSDLFVYDGIKFNSLAYELRNCEFYDVVPNDNGVHYSTLPSFSFFARSITELVDRIKANLNRIYTGDKAWIINLIQSIDDDKEVNITADKISVWDALALCYTEFGYSFTIKGRTITIGSKDPLSPHIFELDKGLIEIERTSDTDSYTITRLRAYGSEKNIPNRYYNGIELDDTPDSPIRYIPDGMNVPRLMLPDFPKQTLDPYIDSNNINAYGIREGSVYFDGTNNLPDIYPSLEGMTGEKLNQLGITTSTLGRVDILKDAQIISDNGKGTLNGDKYELRGEDAYFTVYIHEIGFDINNHLCKDGTTPVIAFKSGMLAGREFEISKCVSTADGYSLKCVRAYDNSLKLWFPYLGYNAQMGDEFVLLHIDMPEAYIRYASQRLLEEAKKYLLQNDHTRATGRLKVDNVYLANQHRESLINPDVVSLYETIKEGGIMRVDDADLGLYDELFYIDKLVIKEGDADIPQYEITFKEEKLLGTLDRLQNKVDTVNNKVNSIKDGQLNDIQLRLNEVEGYVMEGIDSRIESLEDFRINLSHSDLSDFTTATEDWLDVVSPTIDTIRGDININKAGIQSVSNRVQTIEGNYVTLDGTQTISGLKVHKSNTLRVTDAQNYNYVMRSTNTQIPTAENDYAWQWYHWYADSNGTITDSRRGLVLWSYDGENKVFNNVAKFSAHNGNQFRVFGEIRGYRFVRDNGKSTEFLKADGSVDSTTYTPTSRTEALESWKAGATTTLADHETRIVNLDTDLSSLEGVVSNKADKHEHPYLGVDAQAKDSAKLGGQLPTYYAKTTDLSAHISSTSSHTFASITNKPTTVAGYGITDINQYAPKKTDYDAFVAKITKAFTINNDGSVVANIGLSSKGYLSALGTDTTSIGGSGGVSYGRIDNWGELTDSDTSSVPQAKLVKDTLDTKVDKVNGKVLSSNDYSDAEKSKLAGIAEGANNYVHPDTHSMNEIYGLNPTLAGKSNVGHSHDVNDVVGLSTGYINAQMRLLPSVSDTITDRAKFISSDGDGNIHVSMYLRSVTELWDYVNTKASAKYATITSVNDKLNTPNTIKEANLGWGGRDISGNVSPIDAAMISNLSANRLAFAKVDGMDVEFSRDGGATWSPYNCQDYHKTTILNGGDTNIFAIGGGGKSTTDYKLRITLRGWEMGVYCTPQKLFIKSSSNGSVGGNVLIERASSATPNDFKTFKTAALSGWPSWNSVDLNGWGAFGMYEGSPNNTRYDMRLTFGITGVSTNESFNSALAIHGIMMVGANSYRWNSAFAETGHLYSYDHNQNATFPAIVKAPKFIVSNGTASQFLKADGSLDATQYAPKASTLAGYGITDAYTKTDSDKNYFSSLGSATASAPIEIGGSTFGSLLCNGVLPDGLTDKYYYGQHIAINNLYGRFEMYVNHRASSYTDKRGGIAYRSGWADKQPWVTILDSNNYATWLNSTYYTRAEIDNKIKLGIQYLSPIAVPAAVHHLTYYSGQPLLGETDGSAKEGSNTVNLISYPKGGTYASATQANVMRIRMSFGNSHHHEIFSSPNMRQIWHRWVAGSTAYPWSRIVLEDNETETTSSYNIKVRDTERLGGQLPAYYAKQVDLDAHKSDWSVFKAAFDKAFSIDSTGAITAKVGLSSNGWLSALGCDTTGLNGGGGSGAGYDRIDLWSQLGAADTTSVPQAKLVKDTLDTKVDKVAGRTLSSNDFTDGEKAKLAGIADGANNYTHPVSHSISEVEGLQSALNGKAPAHDHPYASNSHDHDATYSKVGHSHTKSEITDFAHKHVVGDITGLSLDWGSITGKPATFEPSTHTHNYAASDHNHDAVYYTKEDADGRYLHYLGEHSSGNTAEAAWGVNGIQDFSNTLPVGLQGKGAYSYGGVASFSGDKSRLDIYFSHIASTASSAAWTKGLWYRTGWQDDKRAWACVLDSGNYEDWVGQKFGSKTDTDALLAWKGNINTWKSSVDINIANLDTDLGNLEATVAGQSSELGDVNATVEALQTKCANLEAQIAELKATLEAMFKLDANGNIKVLKNIYSVGSVSALNAENQQGGGAASSGGNLSQIGGIGEIDGGHIGIESAPAQ